MSIEITTPRRSTAEKIGQVIWPAIRASRGERALDDLAPLISSHPPGGVIVFGEGEPRVDALIAALRLRTPAGLLVSSDLERGCGQQVVEHTSFPAAMAIAACDDPHAAHEAARLTGIEAREAGIDVVHAPVVDVNTAATNPIIATRAFGDRVEQVAAFGDAVAQGLGASGVLAVAKHWPGHGSTVQDSHNELARVTRDQDAIEALDVPPFRRLVDNGLPGVMVGHLAVPALDPVTDRPATTSPVLVDDWLRGRLGFEGLVITDAMDMGGFPQTEAAPLDVLRAGCDVLLMPGDPLEAARALQRAYDSGALTDEVLDRAVGRIDAARARLAALGKAAAGAPRPDRSLAARLLADSITNLGETPTLTPAGPVQLNVFGEDDSGVVVPAFREALGGLGHPIGPTGLRVGLVLTSVAAWLGTSRLTERDRKRLDWALSNDQLDVVCVLGSPYEALDIGARAPSLVGYEGTPATAQQLAMVLAGRARAPGRLPVGDPAPAAP